MCHIARSVDCRKKCGKPCSKLRRKLCCKKARNNDKIVMKVRHVTTPKARKRTQHGMIDMALDVASSASM